MTIRTRFAPSPTGYLHIGGARTALFSWLHARKHGGTFVLRIEDTDRQRSTQASVNAILEGMAWLGLEYDEGPFFQTERMDRYREVIQQLLDTGHAYRCYCSPEELDVMRSEAMARGDKPRYDGRCRDRTSPRAGVEPVIRFRNPDAGAVTIEDAVRGRVVIANSELDDLIIARSDGSPTYNLTVVVDDLDMGITDVVRGDDHLNNTPRQINILAALGAELPRYAHVPMILGPDGKRLSKRHGAMSVMQYRDDGYLPEALLNYLVRLGWSHGDQEIFTIDELISLFDLGQVHSAASAFNTEKLAWLNQHYLKTSSPAHVWRHLSHHFAIQGIAPDNGPDPLELIAVQQQRCKDLCDLARQSAIFYTDSIVYDDKAVRKHLTADAAVLLCRLRAELAQCDQWDAETIQDLLQTVAEQAEVKFGKLAQPLRVALTGNTASPGIDATLVLVGRQRALSRIDAALALIESRTA